MNLINGYKAIFFDLFFTLANPVYSDDSLENEYSILTIDKTIWEEISEKQYYARGIGELKDPNMIVQNIAFEINCEIAQDRLIQATEARINRFKKCLLEIDIDTINTISKIKELQKKIGLISNSDCIDKLGWGESPIAKYFDTAIFSCDIGTMKPDKRIYEAALNIIEENPCDCLYVGDGGNSELKTAKELGMTTILTTNYIKTLWPEKISEIQKYADYKIDGISELLELKNVQEGDGSLIYL
ncbi:HAD family hydrolase [Oceanirhabdus sp. W0125-5]|uniref:HAD family hydrolase n=1 Tax=Oceanirhabdus sp. W0125-5 TaxID=2999116 RepID=UPI0022F3087C|nr:HAD family hydrolase [Oceanirhabdus sp. W0125-5]WBW96944.1 HAD family hydrolase [Oceanirhabdus sp. W0125-5]